MKNKHLAARIKQLSIIADLSPCSRRKVGALIVNPLSNTIISEGYNGTPRQSIKDLCGGRDCLRDRYSVKSGSMNDVGCHHAEMNAILNAVRIGQSTLDCQILINCEPCLMCAKAIHHAGINTVYCTFSDCSTHKNGVEYLRENSIEIKQLKAINELSI